MRTIVNAFIVLGSAWVTELGNDTFNGLGRFFTDYIENSMNISFELVVKDYLYQMGEKLENGTLTGLKGLIQSKEVDFSLRPLGIFPDDELSCCSFPISFSHLTILSGKSISVEHPLCLIVTIFDNMSLLAWLLTGITLFIISTVCEKKTPRPNSSLERFKLAYIYIKTSFYQPITNSKDLPLSNLSRVCFLLWWMLLIIFYNLYAGIYKSQLSSGTLSKEIDNVEELLLQPNIEIITRHSRFIFGSIAGSKTDTDKKLYNRIMKQKNAVKHFVSEMYSPEQMSKVLQGKSVIIFENLNLITKSKEECLRGRFFHTSTEEYKPFPVGFTFSKSLGPKFREDLNLRITRYFQGGHLQYHMNRFKHSTVVCDKMRNVKISDQIVRWSHLEASFQLWFIATGLCLLVLLLERTINYYT